MCLKPRTYSCIWNASQGVGKYVLFFCEQMYSFNALTPFYSVCILQDCITLKEEHQRREVMSVFHYTSWRVRMNYWQTYVFAVPLNEN
jgi:hypothetical protein